MPLIISYISSSINTANTLAVHCCLMGQVLWQFVSVVRLAQSLKWSHLIAVRAATDGHKAQRVEMRNAGY